METVHTGFACIVLTMQANHATPLVDTCTQVLSTCLVQVVYHQTVVVNHTDSHFLPTDARNQCDLILMTVQEAGAEGMGKGVEMVVPLSYTMKTHMLPHLAIKSMDAGTVLLLPSAHPAVVLQTMNPTMPPVQGMVPAAAWPE